MLKLKMKFPNENEKEIANFKSPFSTRIYITVFSFFENTCEWKKCIKMYIMLFKIWKHVFKMMYQTASKSHNCMIFLILI